MESPPSAAAVIDHGDMSLTLTKTTETTKRRMLLFHLVMIFNQLAFAADILLVKSALLSRPFNQLVYAIYRDLIAVVVLFSAAQLLERKKQTPLTWGVVGGLIFCGFTGAFGGQLLMLRGLSLSSPAALASVVIFIPFISYSIAIAFRLEVLKWWRMDGWIKILGMVVACVGVSLLTVRGPAVLGPLQGNGINTEHLLHLLGEDHYQLGLFLCFLGVFSWSVYYSAMVPVLERYSTPFTLAAYAYTTGTCFLAAFAFFTVDRADWIIDDAYTLFVVSYEGVLISGVAMGTNAWALTQAGPILTSSYFPLQTVTTFVASYLFFNDIIFLGQLLGGLIIMAGLYVLTYGKIQTARLDVLEEQQSEDVREPLVKSSHSISV